MTSSVIQDFAPAVEALWAALEAENVRAVVPRNFEGLPHRLNGDLDVLIHPADARRARAALHEASTSLGLRLLFERREASHFHLVFWRPPARAPEGHTFIALDLQTVLGRRGLVYASVEPFLHGAKRRNGVMVPHAAARAVALALHAVLDKGAIRQEYRNVIRRDAAEDLEGFARSVLPRRAAADLVAWIRAGAPAETLSVIRRALLRTLTVAHPGNLIRFPLFRVSRWLRYFGRRRGVLVAFLGPDGAGKSTAVSAVCDAFRGLPFPVQPVYLGKRQPFLPTSRLIHALYLRTRDGMPPADASMRPTDSSWGPMQRVADVLGLVNWVAEQWARYLVHVRPYLQQEGVVVTDRYGFDFAQRPAASVAHTPRLAKLLCRAFPRPERTYFLWEEPAVLRSRKGEDAPPGIEPLLERYRALQPQVGGSRLVRTDRPAWTMMPSLITDIATLVEGRRHS